MKNKYGYSFLPEEKISFQQQVVKKLSPHLSPNSTLIVPETSNLCLLEIAQLTGCPTILLKKNMKEKILLDLDNQAMMKAERQKLISSINAMETVKIANIAGNQRKRFIGSLFQPLNEYLILDKSDVVFLDDSIFSGYTFMAAQHVLTQYQPKNFVLFTKID